MRYISRMDPVYRASKQRRTGCRRNRTRQMTGGEYKFSGPISSDGTGYALNTVTSVSDCLATPRPGTLYGSTGPVGLPGMAGGRRKSRRNNGNSLSSLSLNMAGDIPVNKVNNEIVYPQQNLDSPPPQIGGRYSFSPEVTANGIAYDNHNSIPCESGHTNPLNPSFSPPALPTIPNQQSLPTPMSGGRRSRQAGGVGGVASMFYNAPTAGYTNVADSSVSGNPFLVQTPYEARTLNQACVKTGGRRHLKHRSKKHTKNTTRRRKATSRKATSRKTKSRKTRSKKH